MLMARTGNTDSLALENIGLETDSRGQLKVSMYQTALPRLCGGRC